MLAEDPPKTLILLSKNLSSSSLDTAPKNSSSLLSTGSGLAALLIGLMALSGSLVSLIALVPSVGGWGKFSSGLNLLLILVLSDAEEDDRLLCSVVVWPVTETTGVPLVGVTPNPPGPGVDIEAGFLVGWAGLGCPVGDAVTGSLPEPGVVRGLEVVGPDPNKDDSLEDGRGMASPNSNLISDPVVVAGADVGDPP